MTVRATTATQLVSTTGASDVRITRATSLVSRQFPAEVRCSRVSMLILRSILDGPVVPPPDPPIDPPEPPPPPEEAPRLRWFDTTRVINEFGEDIQERLERYIDTTSSGVVARSGAIDMAHNKIVEAAEATAPFDAIRLQDIPS